MNNRWMIAAGTTAAATLTFAAAALAQTPSPVATGTPGATGTAGTTTAVVTGTTVGTGTAVVTGTSVVSGTSVVNGTPVPTIGVPPSIYQAGGTGGFAYANPAFQSVWDRTDHPVSLGQVKRTFFWGPGPNTPGLFEQYNESPSGNRQRLVQYFDKSRMELNNPNADPKQPFFVTNGLLTVDLISGSVQVGEKDFNKFHPACIPMSGDFGDTLAPTYFAFQKVSVSGDRIDTHPSTDRTGQRVTQTIDRDGTTGNDASKGTVPGVDLVHFEAQTKHNIPSVFWAFLNSSGQVHADATTHQLVTQQLITPWFFASGLPVSEAYWAKAKIGGQVKDVLIQAFERRALTYVPTNPVGFQVEMANIGQHYFDWRYRNFGYCAGAPAITPTAPVPAATGTVTTGTAVATGTAVPNLTAVATGTALATATDETTRTPLPVGTAVGTGTAVITPVGTPVP